MNLRHSLHLHGVLMRRLKSGRFKSYADGVPDYHMMDWRGCNAHVLALPGQPHRGFDRAEDALAWLFAHYESEKDAIAQASKIKKGGSWISSYEHTGFIDWTTRTVKFDKTIQINKRSEHVLDFVALASSDFEC